MNQVSRGLRATGFFLNKRKKSIGISGLLLTIVAFFFFGSYFGSQYKANHVHSLFFDNPRNRTTIALQKKISQKTLISAIQNTNHISNYHLEQVLGKTGGGTTITKVNGEWLIEKEGRKAVKLASSAGESLFNEAYPARRSTFISELGTRRRYGVLGKFFDKIKNQTDEEDLKKKLNVNEDPDLDGRVSGDIESSDEASKTGDDLAKIADDIDSSGVATSIEKEALIAKEISGLKSINSASGILGVYCGAKGFARTVDRLKVFIGNKAFVRIAGMLGVVANSVSVGRANPTQLSSFMNKQLGSVEQSKGYLQSLKGASYFKSNKPDVLPTRSLPTINSSKYSNSPVFGGNPVDKLCQLNNSRVVQGGLIAVNTGAAVATGGVSALIPIIGGIAGITILANQLEPVVSQILTDVVINHSGILQSEEITKGGSSAFIDAAKIGDEIMISEEKRSLGAQKLNPEQSAKIQEFYLAEARKENSGLSPKDQFFAKNNPYSTLALLSQQFVLSFDGNPFKDFVSFAGNLIGNHSNSTQALALIGLIDNPKNQAIALASEDVKNGITEYEFEPELLEIDPYQAQTNLFGNLSPVEILSSEKLQSLVKKYQKCFTGDDSTDFENSTCNNNPVERRNFTVWHLACLATSGIDDFYNDSSIVDYQPCGIYYGPGSGDSATQSASDQESSGSGNSSNGLSEENPQNSPEVNNKNVAALSAQGAQALATQILANNRISFSGGSGDCNMVQAAKYGEYRGVATIKGDKQYRTCDDSGSARAAVSPEVLAILLVLAEKYDFVISSIATGGHVVDSQHFTGRAMDIGVVNGIRIKDETINTGVVRQFYLDLIDLLPSGAKIGQNDCGIVSPSLFTSKGLAAFGNDGCDHIHFGV